MLEFGSEVKQEFLSGRGALQDQAYIRALAVDFFISLLNTVEAWTDRTLHEVHHPHHHVELERYLRFAAKSGAVTRQGPGTPSALGALARHG